MAGNVNSLVADPQFQGLSPADQRKALVGVSGDNSFGSLSDDDTKQFITRIGGTRLAPASNAASDYDAYLKSGAPTKQVRPAMKPTEYHDFLGSIDPNSFTARVGERIKQNVQMIPHLLEAVPAMGAIEQKVAQGADLTPQERNLYTEVKAGTQQTQQMVGGGATSALGKVGMAATIAPRLAYQQAKQYVQDPAALVGDVTLAAPELTELATRRPTLGEVPKQSTLSEVPKPAESAYTPIAERPDLSPEQKAGYVKDIDRKNAILAKQQRAETVTRNQNNLAELIQNDVRNTHDQVRGSLNQRWEDVRQKTAGVEVPAQPITDAIEQSRKMLAGTPEDLRIFDQITSYADQAHREAEAESAAAAGVGTTKTPVQYVTEGGKAEPTTIPFNDARVQFSALGDQWVGAKGNLKRALGNVYDAYNSQLREGAAQAGIGPEYDQLSKDWHQYMEDWRGRGQGAPLAKVLNAPHPNFVPQIVNGTGGQLLIDQYGRYADPQAIRELQRITREGKQPLPPQIPPPPAPESAPPPKPGFIRGKILPKLGGLAAAKVNLPIPGHPIANYMTGSEATKAVLSRIPASPSEYLRHVLDAKEGKISPGEADRRIARAGGKVKVRPLPTPP